ncbi:MAG: SDR family oxidoreductase [Candidatus Methanofastidiosa archaeon]|nr:SDR family oxidoreductase [Candidatus Methanofastidiosa archaeon]
MDIKDKWIVVAGATGGIGREITKELDKQGAKLVLISRSEDELSNLVKTLHSGDSCYFVCDFSDPKETEKVVDSISKNIKHIDILINCAGVGIYKAIEDYSLDEWNNSFNIGVTSQFLLIRGLSKNFGSDNNSLIINIGSGAGVIPMAGRSAYCASKFAVRGLTLSLAEEFRNTNTHICLITLGSVLTSFGPMSLEAKKNEMDSGKAYLTPEWVAKKIAEIIYDDGRDLEYRLYPSDYSDSWQRTVL